MCRVLKKSLFYLLYILYKPHSLSSTFTIFGHFGNVHNMFIDLCIENYKTVEQEGDIESIQAYLMFFQRPYFYQQHIKSGIKLNGLMLLYCTRYSFTVSHIHWTNKNHNFCLNVVFLFQICLVLTVYHSKIGTTIHITIPKYLNNA